MVCTFPQSPLKISTTPNPEFRDPSQMTTARLMISEIAATHAEINAPALQPSNCREILEKLILSVRGKAFGASEVPVVLDWFPWLSNGSLSFLRDAKLVEPVRGDSSNVLSCCPLSDVYVAMVSLSGLPITETMCRGTYCLGQWLEVRVFSEGLLLAKKERAF